MDLFVLLIFIVSLAIVVFFLSRPLIKSAKRKENQGSEKTNTLQSEHEAILSALQDLELDRSMDKISDADYALQRSALMRRGVIVLQKLDGETRKSIIDKPEKRPISGMTDDQLEDLLAERRRNKNGKSTGFCPHCGKPALAKDSFCSHCGSSLI
jgi:hypothetical protein